MPQPPPPAHRPPCIPAPIGAGSAGALEARQQAPPELNLQPVWDELDERGYAIIPDFYPPEEIEKLRLAFRTEFPIMGANGGQPGRVASSNTLAKTRACDHIFMDPRIRHLVKGNLGADVTLNISVLFNLLPGCEAQTFHSE